MRLAAAAAVAAVWLVAVFNLCDLLAERGKLPPKATVHQRSAVRLVMLTIAASILTFGGGHLQRASGVFHRRRGHGVRGPALLRHAGYSGVPAGTIGRVAGAYPVIPDGGAFGVDVVWEGLARHSPADEARGGGSDGFSRRDLFLVFTAGEHAGERAMAPLDVEPEPGNGEIGAARARYAGEGSDERTPSRRPRPRGDRPRRPPAGPSPAQRDTTLQVVVVLPGTEGELAAALGGEDLLLADVDDDEPVVDADLEAADAVGRLASYVSGAERGEPAVQPIAPDGRYELIPLHM